MSIETLHALQEPDLTPPSGIPRPADIESRIAPDLHDTVVGIDTAPSFKGEQQRTGGMPQLPGNERIEEDQVHAEGIGRPSKPSVQDRTTSVVGDMSDRNAYIRGRRVIADVNGKTFTRKDADSIRYPRSHDSDDRGRIKQATGNFLVKLAGVAFVGKKQSSLKPVSDVRSRLKQNR